MTTNSLEIVGVGVLFFATCVTLGVIAAWIHYTIERRKTLVALRIETDARTGVRSAQPFFEPGSDARPIDSDPVTGELVQYGWSVSDLREVASRPAEFYLE